MTRAWPCWTVLKIWNLKVDIRVLHDGLKQRNNVAKEVEVTEFAEEGPGDARFNGDRCKVHIENEAVINRYLMDG